MERSDVCRVEILEIFALELDVLQRSEGGELRETEKRDEGVDKWMCCGRSMRIAVDVDWESVRQSRGQGTEEDGDRGRLYRSVRRQASLRVTIVAPRRDQGRAP